MAGFPKLAAPSRWIDSQQAVESGRTPPNPEPVGTSSLRLAAGVVVLLAVVSWGLWLFADILLKVAY